MRATMQLSQRPLVAVLIPLAILVLSGCSCLNCAVPAFHALAPGATSTPVGVISCAASGTGSIGVLCTSSKTYAFVGKGVAGSSSVEQLDISAGASASSTAPPVHTYTTSYQPTNCSSDEKNQIVFCGSYFSGMMTDIDANAQTSSDFATTASGTLGFSGGSCTICGIAFDPKDTAFIILDPQGFQRIPEAAPHTVNMTILSSDPNENPGDDYVKNWIFNPGYNTGVLQIADFNTGNLYTSAVVSGIDTPDSATVDVATHVAQTPDECASELVTVADLGTATLSGTGLTGTLTVTTGQKAIASSLDGGCLGVDASATDSVLHVTFYDGEFGTGDMGFALMPTTSGSVGITDWAFATFPKTPDGNGWSSGVDPHPITAFNSPAGCRDCAISVNGSFTWVAVIDLNKLIHAPRSGADPHAISATYNLLANHVIAYYKI